MGAEGSKGSPRMLEEIRKDSKYSLNELKLWYGKFLDEYPKGHLDEKQFKQLYNQFYPEGDSDKFAEHNFRMFDVNNDNKINFREFMLGLGIQCRGNTDEKMKWTFSLFDIEKNNCVSRKEMETMLRELYKASNDPKFETTAKAHTDKVYKELDKNADGKLSKEEFLKLANTDPKLLNMILGYNQ